MDTPQPRAGLWLGIVMALVQSSGLAADEIATTSIRAASAGNATLGWHARIRLPVSATYSEYRIEGSSDLIHWQVLRGPVAGGVGISDEILRESVPASADYLFYRIAAEQRMAPAGNYGEAIYGYATEFNRQLQQLGPLSLEAFTGRYSVTNPYLPGVSFDPATARFWEAFNLDPAVHNATNSVDPRLTDYRLNPSPTRCWPKAFLTRITFWPWLDRW